MQSNGSGIALHGVPPSVTSFGFGGHSGFHGVPPSVTSFGFGHSGFHGVPASVTSPNFGSLPLRTDHRSHQELPFSRRHHHGRGFISPFYSNSIAVPYAYPVYVTEPDEYESVNDSVENDSAENDSPQEEDYRGGPTVFDRRGPGSSEYSARRDRDEPIRSEEDYRTAPPASAEPAPQPEVAKQPPTVLVFRNGRQMEISNYAIAGSTLYNLSDGLPKKVALAELDLPATVKENDDRGVDFQLPAGTKAN